MNQNNYTLFTKQLPLENTTINLQTLQYNFLLLSEKDLPIIKSNEGVGARPRGRVDKLKLIIKGNCFGVTVIMDKNTTVEANVRLYFTVRGWLVVFTVHWFQFLQPKFQRNTAWTVFSTLII